jgi:PBP1b-binding outer membrane lipoprotein LpoB
MMTLPALSKRIAAILAAGVLLPGCTTAKKTSERDLNEELPHRILTGPSTKELLEVCDTLSADLGSSALIQQAGEPVVLEIDPALLEDRTGQNLDVTIYAEIIRESLIKNMNGQVQFRDRSHYLDTLADLQAASSLENPKRVSMAESRMNQLAPVDYQFAGFIYRQDDLGATNWPETGRGFRYYRIQLRLIDPQTGLVAWENHYHVKHAWTS